MSVIFLLDLNMDLQFGSLQFVVFTFYIIFTGMPAFLVDTDKVNYDLCKSFSTLGVHIHIVHIHIVRKWYDINIIINYAKVFH